MMSQMKKNPDGSLTLYIQVISDASKSTVYGIPRICRGDVKPPGRLRGSLTKFVSISNGFFGTKDQF
jgi:hypothetical protein